MSSSSPPAALFELLPLHAMGVLDAAEAREVERALAEFPMLQVELTRWHEAIAALGGAPAPAVPEPEVRARLLSSLDASERTSASELARFSAQVAELFDVSPADAAALLGGLTTDPRWRPLLPGIERLAVAGGARAAGRDCSFLRVAPGVRFPWHRHLGEEASLVLAGGAHMSDGVDLRPGDTLVVGPETEHDFLIAADGEPCVFAVRMAGIAPAPRPA